MRTMTLRALAAVPMLAVACGKDPTDPASSRPVSAPDGSAALRRAPGGVLFGRGAAVIDGTLAPGEWDRAARIDFLANQPSHDGGGTTPATLLLMNDGANLYFALTIARSSFGGATNPSFIFDHDNDGVTEAGDDGFGMAVGIFQQAELRDIFHTAEPPCPSLCGFLDVDFGGTNDGETAASNDGTLTVIELSHPLDSPDDLHDFSLGPGDVVGFWLFLRLFAVDPACNFGSACYADTGLPAGSFASMRVQGGRPALP